MINTCSRDPLTDPFPLVMDEINKTAKEDQAKWNASETKGDDIFDKWCEKIIELLVTHMYDPLSKL